VKKFLPELLHFLYLVLQAFIGARENTLYFCGMVHFIKTSNMKSTKILALFLMCSAFSTLAFG